MRILLVAALAIWLAGCGAINSFLGPVIADHTPTWMGALPKGAPPRPGEPGYEKFIEEQEGRALVKKEAPPPENHEDLPKHID